MKACLSNDWIKKWGQRLPNKIAVSEAESGRTMSYRQLQLSACFLASILQNDLELKAGNRIALLAENGIENILLFSVAQKTGSCLVPLNYRLSPSEISHLLLDCSPHLLVYEEKYSDLIRDFDFDKNPIPRLKIEELKEAIERADLNKVYQFKSHIVEEDDPIFILYTSGSTGIPKGTIYSHKMLFWNSINTCLSIALSSETRTIMCMPPFHTGGWNVLTTPLLHFGGHICMLKKFDPELIIKKIEDLNPQVFMAVPTMLKLIAEHPSFDTADLSSLDYLIVGGEPMPVPLIELWHSKGVKVRQGYGMTEVGPNLTSLHHDYAISKKGSIGKTNFYLDYRIVNEDRKEVKQGEIGELLFKGPVVSPGYWNNEQASREALADGWFSTGDLAREDEEGFLYIVDRIKNMFISGGENVYPAEIERVILGMEQIAECAVVPQEDAKWGESGVAFVVAHPNHFPDEELILNHCKKQLAKFKIPQKILFVQSLPKTDSGKIDRKALVRNFT